MGCYLREITWQKRNFLKELLREQASALFASGKSWIIMFQRQKVEGNKKSIWVNLIKLKYHNIKTESF